MNTSLAPARTTFTLPDDLHATEPPEARGLRRDEVRLLIATRSGVEHVRFLELREVLHAGDLVVVNTSETMPAAVDGIRPDGRPSLVHFSSPIEDGLWVVELRGSDGPLSDVSTQDLVYLPDGARIEIIGSYPHIGSSHSRLWRARVDAGSPVETYLNGFGRPITYEYMHARWPLSFYQTVFARERGSAEMPSAARPFSHRLVTDLLTRGVNIAPVLLHAGVSSLEAGETPLEERFEVPASTAWLVNETHRAGGLVVAVGTTVTRALETAAAEDGTVSAASGRTNLVLGEHRPARTIDALITGWHTPDASHLSLLEAVAGPDLVQTAYDSALENQYRWHEFGDSCLLLPRPRLRSLT